ncbi:MAG: hypothetical protein FWH04_03710 [Oscillospiraceae bacterium]|nr:hypothetical protein [Oscillospiraceae bacterium]
MNDSWQKVKDFHKAFGLPHREKPQMLTAERTQKRALWMREEIQEFIDSATIEDQADAMIDLVYFALGTLVEMGVSPGELFGIVHTANMQKLWPDGKVHYNADGKVIKSENWQDPAPLLRRVLREQMSD